MVDKFMISKAHDSEFVYLFDIWEQSVLATHDFVSKSDFELIKDEVIPIGFTMVELYVYKNQSGNILGFIGIKNNKVEMLFISPKHFGEGIGSLLLDYAISEFNIKIVDVNEQNQKALEFYQKKDLILLVVQHWIQWVYHIQFCPLLCKM